MHRHLSRVAQPPAVLQTLHLKRLQQPYKALDTHTRIRIAQETYSFRSFQHQKRMALLARSSVLAVR